MLTPHETEELFTIIRSLTATGTTIIFITHKLNEVLEVADNIVVLRRGRVAGTADPEDDDAPGAGEPDGRARRRADRRRRAPPTPGDVVLSLRDLQVRDDRLEMAVDGVDLDVRAGEIVAIAGVQGNGQTELVEAITGLRTIDSGEMTIGGAPRREGEPPRQVSDLGVAHIPEDRGRDGLIAT